MITHSMTDAPRSPVARARATRFRSSSSTNPRGVQGAKNMWCLLSVGWAQATGLTECRRAHDLHDRGVEQEDEEAYGEQELGHDHGLGARAGLALGLGELAAAHRARARRQGVADLRTVVRDERQGGGQVTQLVDAQVVAELAEPEPRRLAAQPRRRKSSRGCGPWPSRR